MPVTMAQVVIFALASIAVGAPDSTRAIAAAVFPLSSPYVMIARAAEVPGSDAASPGPVVAAAVGRAVPAHRFEHLPQERAQVGPVRRRRGKPPRLRRARHGGFRNPVPAERPAAAQLMASRAISSSFAISARCGNGPWLIRATPADRPVRLGRRAGEGDDVERQRHLADDALDLRWDRPGAGRRSRSLRRRRTPCRARSPDRPARRHRSAS